MRKRIIKLLKSLYETGGGGRPRQIDICTKLVSRMSDDDDSVKVMPGRSMSLSGCLPLSRKALAVKTLEELWLSSTSDAKAASSTNAQSLIEPNADSAPEERAKSVAFVIMGVAANFGDRQSPLEDLFHQVSWSSNLKP